MADNSYPPGIANIIGNEAAERFSYYGMKTILVVFMTKYLLDQNGRSAVMSAEEAKFWYHLFGMANYFFPLAGAIIADVFWGKYKTIINLSIVYCLGHAVLAWDDTRFGLGIGLTLIAIGAGGIKPCVSAHVGDQFNAQRSHLIERIFAIFYFAINLGAFVSSLLTPVLLKKYGPSVAFGVPGLFMLLATWIFWLGRRRFIAVPAAGWQRYRKEVLSAQGRKALVSLSAVYLFISVFWSLFDQTGSSWVLQAEHMNKNIDLNFGAFDFESLRFELLASQIQALNPVLILLFIPVFTSIIYPQAGRLFELNSLRKIFLGMLLAALSFAVVGLAEARIQAGNEVSVLWQFCAYVILTAAEVMVSITALEFSYTQAPHNMKSVIMGLYMLSVSLGNLIAALANKAITVLGEDSMLLRGANYYYFFTGLMLITALIFAFYARTYKEESYIQDIPRPENESEKARLKLQRKVRK